MFFILNAWFCQWKQVVGLDCDADTFLLLFESYPPYFIQVFRNNSLKGQSWFSNWDLGGLVGTLQFEIINLDVLFKEGKIPPPFLWMPEWRWHCLLTCLPLWRGEQWAERAWIPPAQESWAGGNNCLQIQTDNKLAHPQESGRNRGGAVSHSWVIEPPWIYPGMRYCTHHSLIWSASKGQPWK